jgi:predicted aldo/keto reductase-like oxidoreductase
MAVAIEATVEAEIYDVVLTSVNFTMADDTRLLGAIENAARQGVGVVAMKTQVGGRSFPNPERLRDYSETLVNSAALKWICHNEHIATSIPGIANYDHLRTDVAIGIDPEYTESEREFLADRDIRLGMEFCRQCRYCLSECPQGVDIPTLMRTHMYARQYTDFEKARRTLDSIPPAQGLRACISCDTCSARCANSVNIPRKLEELKLLYA